jgi:anaerobic magnesium-protoporphyrin IX monomethyl ester cyclase
MKILFLYPNAEGYPRVSLGISILMTIIAEKGHQVELFDTTFILSSKNIDALRREQSKTVLPTDTSHFYNVVPPEEVDELLRNKVKSFSPDLVAATIVEENYPLADHLLHIIKTLNKNIITLVGGSTPTIAADVMMENPVIDFLIQGEGEEAMPEFCELIEAGKSIERVQNLWYKKDGNIYDNPVRPYVDMDTLPIQNLDFWEPGHFVKPYVGRLYKMGTFELSRGCPFKCTFCINEQYHDVLEEAGGYFRKKSIANGIKEIKAVKEKLGLELIFFADDNFLQMSDSRMEEFTKLWSSEINLAYWINTTVETISRQRLEMLKKTNCAGIGLGIESGSEWLRQNVLRKPSTNERIETALKMIHEFDIRTTANCMIGFPGEYEADIFETIKLFKELRPKSYGLSFVAPYIGTPIHKLCVQMGSIETLDKPGFRGMVPEIEFRGGGVYQEPQY